MTHPLHEKAKELVARYRRCEADLIELLQKIESEKIFIGLGYSSMHQYCVRGLTLTDAQAYSFIGVSRACANVPELKAAISSGDIGANTAIKMVSVLNREPSKARQWIELAKKLPQKELEREVAKTNPDVPLRETIKPLSQNINEVRFGLSHEYERKLTRCREIANQKRREFVSLEKLAELLIDNYLDENDAVRKASETVELFARIVKPTKGVSARVKRALLRRDQGKCQHILPDGGSCGTPFWTEVHHIVPKSGGGSHREKNLITLCKAHHQRRHFSG